MHLKTPVSQGGGQSPLASGHRVRPGQTIRNQPGQRRAASVGHGIGGSRLKGRVASCAAEAAQEIGGIIPVVTVKICYLDQRRRPGQIIAHGKRIAGKWALGQVGCQGFAASDKRKDLALESCKAADRFVQKPRRASRNRCGATLGVATDPKDGHTPGSKIDNQGFAPAIGQTQIDDHRIRSVTGEVCPRRRKGFGTP